MEKKSPLKRDKSLIFFSQEHHHALVFCTRLKKADASIEEKIIKDFIQDFWENNLDEHFRLEEKLFLQSLSVKNELTDKFLNDHHELRALFSYGLQTSPPDLTKLKVLADTLIAHIRFEERIFFPFLEKELSTEVLAEIGEELAHKQIVCTTFKPEFWKQRN
ncbi:MAG: hypothetical protein A3F72_18775 [Bacteroidetes bacterium RIFCSPLOWO2_12_FULL_35_15]|nr:MAG: hypothetical protein A3F72_18775 [Bacteroidetes bacterium RIFCSPLOWO2_12_FULL_35_15]